MYSERLRRESLELIDNAEAEYIIEDERNIGSPINVKFNGELYAEQQSAVDEMLKYETVFCLLQLHSVKQL